MTLPRAAWLAAACVWLAPAPAEAASVGLAPHPEGVYGHEFRLVAAPGERNRVRVDQLQAPVGTFVTVEIHDAGAALAAGEGCASVDEHTVTCTDAPGVFVWGVRLLLRDEDDQVEPLTAAGGVVLAVAARGGPGDDRLAGSDGLDDLDGEGGRDEIHGGAGDDVVSGGDRADDVIAGGAGTDTVSYAHRRAPVRVDLARSRGGAQGEVDRLAGIERIRGGQGDDHLAGNAGANVIDGLTGRDVLSGRSGADDLRSGGRSISCGKGEDIIRVGHPATSERELMARDCERIEVEHVRWWIAPHPTRATRRAVRFKVRCPWDPEFDEPEQVVECAGRLRLVEPGRRARVVGRGAFPRGAWSARPVDARLTRLGRRFVARPGGVRARVNLTLRGGEAVSWIVRLGSDYG
jgi:hypothetical protein